MNLQKKGWLKDYFELKDRELKSGNVEGFSELRQHPDQTLYSFIQPTGLMYGYPVKIFESFNTFEEKSKVKLILIDSLVNCYLLSENRNTDYSSGFEKTRNKVTELVGEFYNAVYPENSVSIKNFFGKKRDSESIVEKTLDKRIKNHTNENFWRSFFHNSLLFLDIYFFRHWLQTKGDKLVSDLLKSQKDDLRTAIVKVMAAAAHSNKIIEPEEKKLFTYFIETVDLPPEKKKEAFTFFEEGVMVEELDFSEEHHSWILKKYLLELAILTTWADKKIEDVEMEFLVQFNKKLGFNNEEFEYSLIAIEGFVLEYWEELDKLQNKQDFDLVAETFSERLEKIVAKNKDNIINDIYRRGNLVKLIKKAKTSQISDEERKYITEQLIKSLETLPAVEIIALPRKYLTLEVLMKLLPADFFEKIR